MLKTKINFSSERDRADSTSLRRLHRISQTHQSIRDSLRFLYDRSTRSELLAALDSHAILLLLRESFLPVGEEDLDAIIALQLLLRLPTPADDELVHVARCLVLGRSSSPGNLYAESGQT